MRGQALCLRGSVNKCIWGVCVAEEQTVGQPRSNWASLMGGSHVWDATVNLHVGVGVRAKQQVMYI